MKKLLSFALALVLVLSMCISASAAEISGRTVLVKTWKNPAGETVTGIITKGSDTPDAYANYENTCKANGFITRSTDDATVTPYGDVSDYFYMQIRNSNNQIVSKYKVSLTGKVSLFSKKITSVSITRESGDVCTTDYSIDGNSAYVIITHPREGYLDGTFTLNSDGSFTVS